jgi:putative transposase
MSTRMDEEDWAHTLEVFRACLARRGRKSEDDRRFLEALHFFTVENVRWRALPERFGPWNSVWKRFDRLSKAGVFEAFFDALAAMSSSAHLIRMFDSTIAMQRRKSSREFKVEAVRLVRERGASVAQASRDIAVHENVVRKWVKEFGADPKPAFPGHGQMKPEQLEIDRLRREVAKLKAERDMPQKRPQPTYEGVDMKFGFIAKHRSAWPVAWLCEAVGVSRSGLHAWLKRGPGARSREDDGIMPAVRASFVASARTYGAHGIWRDVLEAGFSCGLHKIERLRRAQALRARPRRRAQPKDGGERSASAIAPNVLDRQSAADQAQPRKWIADSTYVWTAEGWLYVAAVIDLFSRRVVGWSMKAEMSARFVTDAFLMATWRRGRPGALLHHSDSQRITASFRAA